jgi:HlyD family secretion protein
MAWVMAGDSSPRYATAAVERGNVVRAVTASGMVNPVETVQIGSYVSGRIQDLFCDYNTAVKKGQSCAKIDPRSYQATVEQAAAALMTAQAERQKDRANFTYLKRAYDRTLGLARRGVVSEANAENAENAYLQAQAQLALDDAAMAQRAAELKGAQVNLDYTDIISPVDGTVVSRSVAIGQTVAASFQTPTLFLIATDLTQMQVDANVSEADIGEIRGGEAASFTVEAFPDRTFTGVVMQVRQAPVSVQNVVSYDVVVKVANPDLALKPGMTATVRLVTTEHDHVLRVPESALRFSPGGSAAAFTDASATPAESKHGQVWVLRGNELVRVPVTLGLGNEDYAEVVSGGLEPGDRIVTGTRPRDAAPERGAS